MIDNYFNSYNKNRDKSFIFPEINKITKTFKILVNRIINPIILFSKRVTKKFSPYTLRFSHPIELNALVYGPDGLFYKVFEGYYELSSKQIKLKVKKYYGK
jgi:hypothetical protein